MSKKGYINESEINKILALIIDMNNEELALLINRLREEQHKRNKGRNLDTIST